MLPTGQNGVSLRVILPTLLLAYLVYSYIQKRLQHRLDKAFGARHGCLPMETKLPYKWPFALDILKRQYDALPSQRVLAFQSHFFNSMGPNMELRLFGKVGYMTTDPRNIEALLSTRFEGKASNDVSIPCLTMCNVDFGLGCRRAGLFPLLGEGIFTQEGRHWKHSRELLRRQFVRIQYQNLKVFDDHVKNLLADISSSSGIVDLQPAFFRFTLATTTVLLFGEPVASLEDEEHDIFAKSFDYASFISAIRLRLADFHWAYKPSKFRKACATVKRYADHFVQLALKDKEAFQRHTFIRDLYCELKDPTLVRDQLVNVLIAGRDTTACLMSWTFYLLVRHSAALERLRHEIMSVAADSEDLTRAHIQKLAYLKCVLNETLRLYPQLPVNVRFAVKTTLLPSVGGSDGHSPVLIPRGTGIGYSVYHMHRQKNLYGQDANEFRPERWEEPGLEKIGWGFLPFHGGPRACLGKDFALMEASYGIVRIIQTFPKIRLPDGVVREPTGQEKQCLTIVVSSAEGCKVVLE